MMNSKKAEEVLRNLQVLGCNRLVLGPCNYLSIEAHKKPMGQAGILKFARLIRDATNLEKSGNLIPNINRMGEVVGWHLPHKFPAPSSKKKKTKDYSARLATPLTPEGVNPVRSD